MFHSSKSAHVSPSGFILPEENRIPSREGIRPFKSVTSFEAQTYAGALLANREGFCQQLGLLPAGYDLAEPADFQEFFEPGGLLAELEDELEAGMLELPDSGELEQPLIEAVALTIQEYQRLFDHRLPLSQRLRMRMMQACREELVLLKRDLAHLPPRELRKEAVA